MIYDANLTVRISAASRAEAQTLAAEAREQIELRVGDGPHSIAGWVPGVADGRVVAASLRSLVERRNPPALPPGLGS